jgi:hypothetical protein
MKRRTRGSSEMAETNVQAGTCPPTRPRGGRREGAGRPPIASDPFSQARHMRWLWAHLVGGLRAEDIASGEARRVSGRTVQRGIRAATERAEAHGPRALLALFGVDAARGVA